MTEKLSPAISASHASPESDQLRDLLIGALIPASLVDEGESDALAAFRAARDSDDLNDAPTRSRDDWRPRPTRHPRRLWRRWPMRITFGTTLASLSLSGAAFAALAPDDEDRPENRVMSPSPTVVPKVPESPSSPPAGGVARAPSDSSDPGGPSQPGRDDSGKAKDIEAKCRADFRGQASGHGNSQDLAARKRLAAEAGEPPQIANHCENFDMQADRIPHAKKTSHPSPSVDFGTNKSRKK